ncbi:MAG: methyltransferase domain-containing protein [Chloroflexi bacterium]|nr:methyltransferase domain-containing protein [Chloroflexota bacterium]
MTEPANHKLLLRQKYLDPKALRIRRHVQEAYLLPAFDFQDWVLSRHSQWRGDEVVLDVNPAESLQDALENRVPDGYYVAADWSQTLLDGLIREPTDDDEEAAPTAPDRTLYDAMHLPFGDDSFDVVLANDFLYHLLDHEFVIQELRRILKPTGILFAATQSQYSMAEFDTLTRRALTLLGYPPQDSISYFGRFVEDFSLENGWVKMARHFPAVVRHEIPSAFVFTETRAVIDYLNSTRVARERSLPPMVTWDDYIMVMTDQIRRLINHFGELVVNRLSGVILATERGGFAQPYSDLRERMGSRYSSDLSDEPG